MDQATKELIEKYKSEMQKMISNVGRPNEQTKNITENRTTPQIAPQTDLQAAQEFPRFEADSQGLRQRIEEILRQNSDVATSDDYPSAQPVQTLPRVADNAQNLPSDPAFETPPPPISFSLDNALDPQISSQNAQEQIQSEITEQTGLNETQQDVVSRTCIRGGAKAQYSPPANTGSSRQPEESENPALSGVGRLRVETFAANRAYPIKNAVIRIKNPSDNSLVAVLVTNEDGITESVGLPAPSGSLSQTPEFSDPFFNYNVDIRAEGYTPRENLNAQMFGGIDSLISANLVPKEPFGRSGENG
ncbi:MAG: hypothetical protein IIX89_02960 [Oscillospiraceae bacterium]|nr:hypothetical protein [Oscillospiraceae bacterium]